MCGICGIFNRPTSEAELRAMAETLRHRGPDDEGYYLDSSGLLGLGHRRLSIIDLETGRQPIANEDRSVWVVFNGEIYNYRQLRRDLEAHGHVFRTQTDTEVLVHAYEEYGRDLVHHITGIFSFAIWDEKKRCLLLARDRAGVKPLYYAYLPKERVLVFASEIKSILKAHGIERHYDPESLNRYLTFLYVPGAETFFRGIFKLMPGYRLAATQEGISLDRYWDLSYPVEDDAGADSVRLRGLLDEVVSDQMMSDVPVGSLLSGGIDSSAICALLARHSAAPLSTFSVGYEREARFDEMPFAAAVGAHLRADMHTIQQEPLEFAAHLEQIVWHLDQPCAGAAAIPLYFVSRLAKQHVKVLFSGEGGDELFVGYPRYLMGYMQSLWPKEPSRFLTLFYRFCHRWGWRQAMSHLSRLGRDFESFYYDLIRFFGDEARSRLLTPEFAATVKPSYLEDFRILFDNPGRNPLEKLLYIDFKTYLASLLEVVDKITMMHSLEARVPLLDDRVIAFSAGLGLQQRIGGMETKKIFKDAMRPLLPAVTFTASKKGFLVPLESWLRLELKEYACGILLDDRARRRGIFASRAVEKLLRDHSSGRRNHASRIWALLNVELWFQKHIDA